MRAPSYLAQARARLDDVSGYREGTLARDRVLAGRSVFADPVFWKAVPAAPRHIDPVLRSWYPSLSRDSSPIRALREGVGEAFVPLLLDPGIACRVEDFLPFAARWREANPQGSPFQLRQAFGQSLGTSEVYRALSVDEEVAKTLAAWTPEVRRDAVRDRGLREPPSLRPGVRAPQGLLDALFEGVMRPRPGGRYPGFVQLMAQHIVGGSGAQSLLTSYTRYPEVALSVTGTKGSAGQRPLLMTARVPELSLVKSTGLLEGTGLTAYGRALRITSRPAGGAPGVEPGFDHRLPAEDPGIEVFTFLHKAGVIQAVDVPGQRAPAVDLFEHDWRYSVE